MSEVLGHVDRAIDAIAMVKCAPEKDKDFTVIEVQRRLMEAQRAGQNLPQQQGSQQFFSTAAQALYVNLTERHCFSLFHSAAALNNIIDNSFSVWNTKMMEYSRIGQEAKKLVNDYSTLLLELLSMCPSGNDFSSACLVHQRLSLIPACLSRFV